MSDRARSADVRRDPIAEVERRQRHMALDHYRALVQHLASIFIEGQADAASTLVIAAIYHYAQGSNPEGGRALLHEMVDEAYRLVARDRQRSADA